MHWIFADGRNGRAAARRHALHHDRKSSHEAYASRPSTRIRISSTTRREVFTRRAPRLCNCSARSCSFSARSVCCCTSANCSRCKANASCWRSAWVFWSSSICCRSRTTSVSSLTGFLSPKPIPDRATGAAIRTTTPSGAAFLLDHEDARFADRTSHVLGAHRSIEDVAGLQHDRLFAAVLAVAHLHLPVEDGEDFLPVVDVPIVGLVGPVQARGDAVHVGDVQRAPGPGRGKCLAADDLHVCPVNPRFA